MLHHRSSQIFPSSQAIVRAFTLALVLVIGTSTFGVNADGFAPANLNNLIMTTESLNSGPTRFLPADWDGRHVRKPAVIKDGSDYKMWYEGDDYWEVFRVGLAASGDGTSWVKHPGNPVLDRGPADWEVSGEQGPFVMFHEGLYKMWYEGSDGNLRQLGYATSPDGLNWTKYAGNPVLKNGTNGFDQDVAGHGSILFEDSTYKLWYHAIGDQGAVIAYATSPDGINWTKEGPVLLPDPLGWDDGGLWGPTVIKVVDDYWMWYSAGSSSYDTSIGFASSTDGTTWTRSADPVISIPGKNIGDPTVLLEGETFKIWFHSFLEGIIYYAESDDGIDWGTPAPVLYPGLIEPLQGFHDGSEGEVRSTGCNVFGWAADPDDPNHDVTIQVLVDDIFLEELSADQYRDDIDPAICPDGTCGYAVDLWGQITPGVQHTITVQAYDVESQDWWGLEATPKSLTCLGYPEGQHDGDHGIVSYPACNAFGWAVDPDDRNRDLTVQVLMDGEVLDVQIASNVREDVDPLICPLGTCGFGFELADKISLNLAHEIKIQAYDVESESWQDLYNTPQTLTCQGSRLYLPLMVHQIREGERLAIFESGSQTFPANMPFHVAHGWQLDFPTQDYDLFNFELEIDGVNQEIAFIETYFDDSDPPLLSKISVFNFPQGMTGTHIFNGHWIGPCYVFDDDCLDPLELWMSTSEVTVTFEP
jgi:predicted GH43/DUF377 family glycosyl hydrolase